MKDNIKEETLRKIKDEKITIKPKSYFRILSATIYMFSAVLVIFGIYIFNLMFYLPNRTLRMIENGGLREYLSLFPWPLIIVGAAIVGLLIYLYRNYEGGYKKQLGITALIISALIIFGGLIITRLNINESLENTPPFQQFYEWNEDNFVPRGPRGRMHDPRLDYVPFSNSEIDS